MMQALWHFANGANGRLLQFEEVWRLIHEPKMSDQEADAVLRTAFPDEA